MGKSKEAKAAAAAKTKGAKKKWSKHKLKSKVENMSLLNSDNLAKLYNEVVSYKMISKSILAERLNIKMSVAGCAINELLNKGLISTVVKHSRQGLYTRNN